MKSRFLSQTLLATLLGVTLSACSLTPQSTTPVVQITQQEQVSLPTPGDLGYSLTASQLIEATWNSNEQKRTEQLPVQLQVSSDKLVLAGFSSWGTRILSLNYQDDKITTEVLSGLGGVLPPPEQVLFNLMITLWPVSAWEAPLNKVRWQIIDNYNTRAIFDNSGNKVIDIQYSNKDRLSGDIVFHHLIDNYTIKIKTLQFNKV
ncbi:DUF3261 domain-containing protein [Vibrio europaeus]|uniref:DUF3261 domain-containing protein n=1 Tax=Vibrio europaeus TaxID=300876 RepID=A0A178J7L2_9VIBR|nr:DUF3261 domain-containing protein [Vibrio europaeus]MDC5705459.1 DUF3261 domain-containing protein [Vibrio europaeus]MDC5710738.1 DUF3261 domain-containing protein [Vibrio europaeus]MDC5715828.1 DUF3261 domain-containing protein [Vibrio europaeus]MDC5719989.1 DUF3261 domain-containing protein [Vibrio europaeus]MDC5724124.1 DUF3261 domain-containing protein [Vibrio europaeus]